MEMEVQEVLYRGTSVEGKGQPASGSSKGCSQGCGEGSRLCPLTQPTMGSPEGV